MYGLGTIINVAAIVIGGLGGTLFGKLLKENVQETLMKTCAIYQDIYDSQMGEEEHHGG